MAAKSKHRVGDEVVLRGTITIAEGDRRVRRGMVVVSIDGYHVPVAIRTEKIRGTGKNESDTYYYFPESE